MFPPYQFGHDICARNIRKRRPTYRSTNVSSRTFTSNEPEARMGALGIRTIIVATDLSDELIPVVQTAARLAQLTGAHLHVVHTTEAPIPEAALTDYLRAADI